MEANGVRASIGDVNNEVEKDPMYLVTRPGQRGIITIRDFQSLVGSLLWIARCTRPDISIAVHKDTRRTTEPSLSDWKLAKRITRYLRKTKSMKLRMEVAGNGRARICLASWSDSDFAADKLDLKSVTGEVVTMDGAVVQWICKKQTRVSLSTMEAEFISASHVT